MLRKARRPRLRNKVDRARSRLRPDGRERLADLD